MKLQVLGDEIWTDDGELIAMFNTRLGASRRDRAEELLMHGAAETDWDLRERVYEQQNRIDELEYEVARLKTLLEEAVHDPG
jgi:hypothetical protein